jgi:DNA-binding CsgD family transcriptional regulator
MVHHDQCSGLEELAEVVRDAQRAGVPPAQLDLLRELARADSPAHVASARGVSARTIRKHREHAIAMVRHTVAA